MALYLQVDDSDDSPQVASNTGWGDFCRWVGSFPAGQAMAVRELCAHGWTGRVDEAATGLRTALEKQPPAAADVQNTATGLLKLLAAASGAEVVSVTDGIGSE